MRGTTGGGRGGAGRKRGVWKRDSFKNGRLKKGEFGHLLAFIKPGWLFVL